MSTRLSQPRALGWEVWSGLMSGNDYESFPKWSRKFAFNFARNRLLPQCIAVSVSANCVPWQGPMSTRLSQPRALAWEALSGLMSGNDYESFSKLVEEICLKFCTQPALAPQILLSF